MSWPENADDLCRDAEARLRQQTTPTPPTGMDAQRLLHELQVHRVELEMQNEALREAHAAVEKSRDLYLDLFEFAPVAYIMLTPEGLIASANQSASRMLGTGRKPLLGMRFAALVAPPFRERWRRLCADAMADADRHMLEVGLDAGAGLTSHVHIVCQRAEAAGEAPTLRVALSDIGGRKRLESEVALLRADLKQIMEWQIARHAAAALAHEINQPLASISALSEAANLVLGARPPESPAPDDRLAHIVGFIAAESDRAGAIVRDLLESLRMKPPALEKLALRPLLHDAVDLAAVFGFDDCEVIVDRGEGIPSVLACRPQLQNVIVNLIGNAMESMRASRRAQGRVWLSAAKSGDAIRISVRDEGPGVQPGMEHTIFHPFVTTKSGHIGMGLAISRSLIEAQGGRLWHETGAVPGAAFHLSLPCPE